MQVSLWGYNQGAGGGQAATGILGYAHSWGVLIWVFPPLWWGAGQEFQVHVGVSAACSDCWQDQVLYLMQVNIFLAPSRIGHKDEVDRPGGRLGAFQRAVGMCILVCRDKPEFPLGDSGEEGDSGVRSEGDVCVRRIQPVRQDEYAGEGVFRVFCRLDGREQRLFHVIGFIFWVCVAAVSPPVRLAVVCGTKVRVFRIGRAIPHAVNHRAVEWACIQLIGRVKGHMQCIQHRGVCCPVIA